VRRPVQVRQDKLIKQPETQLRGKRWPTAASNHSDTPENWILPDAVAAAENPASRRLSGKLRGPEKPQPVDRVTCLPFFLSFFFDSQAPLPPA
jgi:hypothetical protein